MRTAAPFLLSFAFVSYQMVESLSTAFFPGRVLLYCRKTAKGGLDMLRLLYARAGQVMRGEVLERMGGSKGRRRLVLVPEQYSH